MSHGFYVYSSYLFAALLVLGLLTWIWADGRRQRRDLAALEAAGFRRRSQREAQSKAPQ